MTTLPAPSAAGGAPTTKVPPLGPGTHFFDFLGRNAPDVVKVTDVLAPGQKFVHHDDQGFSAGPNEVFTGSLEDAIAAASAYSLQMNGGRRADAVGVFQAGKGAYNLRLLWQSGTDFGVHLTLDGPDNFFSHLATTDLTRVDKDMLAVVGGRRTAMFDTAGRAQIRWH